MKIYYVIIDMVTSEVLTGNSKKYSWDGWKYLNDYEGDVKKYIKSLYAFPTKQKAAAFKNKLEKDWKDNDLIPDFVIIKIKEIPKTYYLTESLWQNSFGYWADRRPPPEEP